VYWTLGETTLKVTGPGVTGSRESVFWFGGITEDYSLVSLLFSFVLCEDYVMKKVDWRKF
jgi:hypothetical protein